MADQRRPDNTGDRPDRSARPERSGGGRPDRSGAAAGRAGGRGSAPARNGASRGAPGAGGARREEIEQRTYDPRREERRRAARVPLPDEVDARMLDREVRQELRSLTKETAELVARHLVVTGQLLDDDPEQALVHARAARALAGRVGAVREAAGLAAYAAGEWAEALTELRAARRISGSPEHLAVMADCERALDRPERALSYADDPDVARLEQAARVELVIVLSGARRDMGQAGAAVLELQDPARRTKANRPWAARLWYAYADALLAAGREDEARKWFVSAADLDADGETDAAERLLELDGVVFDDLELDDDPESGPVEPAPQAEQPEVEPQVALGVEPAVDAVAAPEPEPEPEPEPALAEAQAEGAAEPVSVDKTEPASESIPAVSFQAPDDGDELTLFD